MTTPKQLEELIVVHRRPLELFASQWTLAPEDCVQEVFVKLFCNQEPIQNPRAWLYRVTRNLAIDAGRSESRRKIREQATHESRKLFASLNTQTLSSEELQIALQKLPHDQREIIVTRIWGELTLAEIGQAFDIAPSTVHRRYELGIQQLKSFL